MEVGAQATDDSLDMGLAAAAETGPAAAPELDNWLIARRGMFLLALHNSGRNTPAIFGFFN